MKGNDMNIGKKTATLLTALAVITIDLASVHAAEKPAATTPEKPNLTTRTGGYQSAWLTLEGAGEPCRVFVAWREGKPVQFWSTRTKLPGVGKTAGAIKLLTDTLRGDAGKVTVELRLVSVWAPISRLALQTLTLDLNAGTWELAGVAKGTLKREAAVADPIAAGQDWPSFHGVMSACAGPEYGKPFIADLAQAKPLWRSEAVALNAWGSGAGDRYKDRAAVGTLCGGASSPVVADGIVYLYSYLPSGDAVLDSNAMAMVEKYKDHPVEQDHMRRWFSTRADVVVTALDGATGKTVWQSVWPLKQGNFQAHKWRGPNPTPAVAKGTLVVADYSWGVHAYDAKTGALRWSRGDGGPVTRNSAPVGPVIAGNVVVWATGGGTVGLDLETGKELWKAPGGASARRMMVAGKERVLIVGGTSSLVDAATGKVLWSSDVVAKDKLFTVAMPVCDGDKMVSYTATTDPQTGKVVAYTVTDAGIEKAWESEPGTWDENMVLAISKGRVYAAHKAEGLRCLDLATGKTLGAIAELKCGSNAGLIVVDDRLFYQPEGQHGSQHIHLVDAGKLTVLGGVWNPQHNDATAYGQMALGNVVVDGRLIVRGMDGVYCYDLRVPRRNEVEAGATAKPSGEDGRANNK